MSDKKKPTVPQTCIECMMDKDYRTPKGEYACHSCPRHKEK